MADGAAFAATWLVTYLLHSTLLYAAAWMLERLLPRAAPAPREFLWRAALLGALVTASLQSAGLVERVPLRTLLAPSRSSLAVTDELPFAPSAAASPVQAPAATASLPAPSAASGAPPAAAPAGSSWLERAGAAFARHGAAALLAIWLAGAGLAALRWAHLGRLARAELSGLVAATGPLAAELSELCAAQRVRQPALGVAPRLAGPVSLPGGGIAVPPWALSALDRRQRRALLAHELAHQVRRDPQWQLGTLALAALLWPQPLHRLARRRLAALAELQADAWAVRAVKDPRALAECLAECAGRLAPGRSALLGSAMLRDSLLVERVNRLLEGKSVHARSASWPLRGGVLAALAAAAFLFPGCDLHTLHLTGSGSSTTIEVSSGGETEVSVTRPGYALHLQATGATTFLDDESDLATLEAGCTFTLRETADGVTHEYEVKAARDGRLARSFSLDGHDAPADAAAAQWLAGALPRMFRESGFDLQARVARLLAQGGPERVLVEVEQAGSDSAKAGYLGALLGSRRLDDAQTARALDAVGRIRSDYELRRALELVLAAPALEPPRCAQVLAIAQQLDSDYERAELLTGCVGRLPGDEAVRTAWLAAAAGLASDYELGRTVQAGLDHATGDAAFTAALVDLAAAHVSSDYALGEVLKSVAPRAAQPAVATAWLAAVPKLGSDYERHTALLALLDAGSLEPGILRGALDATAGIGGDYDRSTVLKAFAGRVAADAELSGRYRDIAATLSDYERGAALLALDAAGRR